MGSHQVTPAVGASFVDKKRERVRKACHRCRLKKSKCDALNPCRRCQSDNAICVYGDKNNPHNKVFPRGYGEMLEQQQAQLVTGLQRLYKKTMKGELWPGPPLEEVYHGNPLTHEILERLGALEQANYTGIERFQENLRQTEQILHANEVFSLQRLPSWNDDLLETDFSSTLKEMSQTTSQHDTPVALVQSPITQSAHSTSSHSFKDVSPPKLQTFAYSTSEQFGTSSTLLSPVMQTTYNHNADFIERYTPPYGIDNNPNGILHGHISSTNIEGYLPARESIEEQDFWYISTTSIRDSIRE